jgi:predicted alpha/beta superfamily hydrolase
MADDNTLFGHSGGGLFCGYSVVTKPAAFNRYVCGSAPFDAGDFQVFRLEEQYAQRNKDMPAKVFSASVSRRCCKGPGVWSARPRNSPKS